MLHSLSFAALTGAAFSDEDVRYVFFQHLTVLLMYLIVTSLEFSTDTRNPAAFSYST